MILSGNALPEQIHDIPRRITCRQRQCVAAKDKLARQIRSDPIGDHGGLDMMENSVAADFIRAAVRHKRRHGFDVSDARRNVFPRQQQLFRSRGIAELFRRNAGETPAGLHQYGMHEAVGHVGYVAKRIVCERPADLTVR